MPDSWEKALRLSCAASREGSIWHHFLESVSSTINESNACHFSSHSQKYDEQVCQNHSVLQPLLPLGTQEEVKALWLPSEVGRDQGA